MRILGSAPLVAAVLTSLAGDLAGQSNGEVVRIGLGFQSSWPTYGVSGTHDLIQRLTGQAVVGAIGTLSTVSAWGLYHFQREVNYSLFDYRTAEAAPPGWAPGEWGTAGGRPGGWDAGPGEAGNAGPLTAAPFPTWSGRSRRKSSDQHRRPLVRGLVHWSPTAHRAQSVVNGRISSRAAGIVSSHRTQRPNRSGSVSSRCSPCSIPGIPTSLTHRPWGLGMDEPEQGVAPQEEDAVAGGRRWAM